MINREARHPKARPMKASPVQESSIRKLMTFAKPGSNPEKEKAAK